MSTPKIVSNHLQSFELQEVLAKIAHTPTTPMKAAAIRKVLKSIHEIQHTNRADFMEKIAKNYYVFEEEKPVPCNENRYGFKVIEGKEEELSKEFDAFTQSELDLPMRFSLQMISDMKSVTVKDLEILGPLLYEGEGPGLPM